MILKYIKSLFKPKTVQVEEPKVLSPCPFKNGDIVTIKFLEDSTKKFKVVDIINWKTSYSLVVEYFYDNRLHTFSRDVDEFEKSSENTSSEITKADWFILSLIGEFYYSRRETK